MGNRRQSVPGGAGRENTYSGMAAEKLQLWAEKDILLFGCESFTERPPNI